MKASATRLNHFGDPIVPAFGAALAIHLLLVMIVGFSYESPSSDRQTLAVTVALTPTQQHPDKATHVAAENQLGDSVSGLNAPQMRMQTALTLSRELDLGESDAENVSSSQTLERKLASLEQAVSALSTSDALTNPRLGSVAARKALDANYLARWRARVEQVGNRLYQGEPPAGNGDVRLLVSVTADGMLEHIQIIASSGNQALDQAAIDTVTVAAPFPPFSAQLAAQTPRLEIVRTWQFRSRPVEPK